MLPIFRRKKKYPKCTVLVPAAGNSVRMGGENKLLAPLEGVPVLIRTLTALQLARRVDEIIVATREEDLNVISRLCRAYHIDKCTKIIVGGETRTHSTLLAAAQASRRAGLLAVHDGARPLVTPALVDRVIMSAARFGAVAPALPVKDTMKQVRQGEAVFTQDRRMTGEAVKKTVDRVYLRSVQTPQAFDADLLKGALQLAVEKNIPVTDDCSAVERLGKTVYLIPGDEENIKITTPIDMLTARMILEMRMNPDFAPMPGSYGATFPAGSIPHTPASASPNSAAPVPHTPASVSQNSAPPVSPNSAASATSVSRHTPAETVAQHSAASPAANTPDTAGEDA